MWWYNFSLSFSWVFSPILGHGEGGWNTDTLVNEPPAHRRDLGDPFGTLLNPEPTASQPRRLQTEPPQTL